MTEGVENGDRDVASGEFRREAAKDEDEPAEAPVAAPAPVACIVDKEDAEDATRPEPNTKLMTHMPINTVPAANMTDATKAIVPSTVLIVPGQRWRP